ncbi:MAG: hypothetical protein Q7S03_02375 [bacterium]|nr:hypothetical protein [bacterium]
MCGVSFSPDKLLSLFLQNARISKDQPINIVIFLVAMIFLYCGVYLLTRYVVLFRDKKTKKNPKKYLIGSGICLFFFAILKILTSYYLSNLNCY